MPDTAPSPSESSPAPAYERQQDAAPANESAPKRRSTVREAAPFASFEQSDGSNGHTASSSAPAREETESKGGGEIEPERPRKSGWWSKFRGG
jgi:hypothetical protein